MREGFAGFAGGGSLTVERNKRNVVGKLDKTHGEAKQSQIHKYEEKNSLEGISR